jgi:hypothetical protein
MKKMYEIIVSMKDVYSDRFPQRLSFLLILFFLVFGAVSLFFLLQTAD